MVAKIWSADDHSYIYEEEYMYDDYECEDDI